MAKLKVMYTAPKKERRVVRTKDMALREAGTVIDGIYKGERVIKTFVGLISLDGKHTWGSNANLTVELFEPGTEITLIYED